MLSELVRTSIELAIGELRGFRYDGEPFRVLSHACFKAMMEEALGTRTHRLAPLAEYQMPLRLAQDLDVVDELIGSADHTIKSSSKRGSKTLDRGLRKHC